MSNIDISSFSEFESEAEILFLPLSCFEIMDISSEKNFSGVKYIEVKLKYLDEYEEKIKSKIEEIKKDEKAINNFFENSMNSKFGKDVQKYYDKKNKLSIKYCQFINATPNNNFFLNKIGTGFIHKLNKFINKDNNEAAIHVDDEIPNMISKENRILYYRIKDAIKKPSEYSKINEPKKCPAFDKEKLLLKRIKHEINNYQENIRFYYRIEKANSFYPKEEWLKRNKELEENSRIFQKSIFDISPNLMFSSPERIKNEIERYRNKRNISKKIKSRPMTQRSSSHKKNNNNLNQTYNVNENIHNLDNRKNDNPQNLKKNEKKNI